MLAFHRKQVLIFFILAGQIFISIAGALAIASIPRENIIFPGVSVNGQYVGGLTKNKAVETLNKRFNSQIQNGFIELQYEKKKWRISYSELGVSYDVSGTVGEILKTGDSWFPLSRSLELIKTNFQKPDVPIRYNVDNTKLDSFLARVSSEINIPAQNASICTYYGNIKVLPATKGKTVSVNAVREKIKTALGKIDTSPIMLEVELHEPEITSVDLNQITDLIGIGLSRISLTNKEKNKVLNDAVKKINGTVIPPEKEFSFNRTVGPVLMQGAIRTGNAISGSGNPVSVSTEGINQAASTLYQAVLYSGLRVTERFSNAVQPTYAPIGQDAAVDLTKMDLKFENNTQAPIYICAEIKDNRVNIKLFGVKTPGQTIQVFGKHEDGSHGNNKTRIKVYRVFYNNGKEIKRELVSENQYLKADR